MWFLLDSEKQIIKCALSGPRQFLATENPLKVVFATFLLVCFVCLNESTRETRKNVFLFHFESSFRS